MTESKLFVSSCSRREMVRRRHHVRFAALSVRLSPTAVTVLAFAVICGGAFLVGRGGF